MKIKQYYFLTIAILLFAVTFIYGMNRYKGEDFGLYEDETYLMNEGWKLQKEDGTEEAVVLPAELAIPKNTDYSISMTVPEDFPEGMSILLRTSQQSICVKINEQVIYERGRDTGMYPGEFRGSSWNTILMLKEYAGQKLTLTLNSPYDNFSGAIGEIHYGYKSALLYLIIREQMPQLVCATIMMIIGMALFLFHAVKAGKGTSSVHIAYLASFAVFCSFYLFGESRMLQFYSSNEFLITSLPFLSEIIFPIPLILYLKEKWMPQHRWIATVFQYAFTVDFVFVVLAQFTGIADFFETIITFHTIVACAILAAMIVSIIETFKYKYEESYTLSIALLVLAVGCVSGICTLYVNTFGNIGFYLQVGILGFEIVMAIDSVRKYNRFEEELKEKSYYERLAYIDALTDGQNRNAYMDHVFELTRKKDRDSALCYALFDMNNLKGINDTYGHAAGDEAIKKTYNSLNRTFGSMGNCYRIGGDEFAVIMEDCTEATYLAASKRLESELEKANQDGALQETGYTLSLAGGYAVCKATEELNFENLMRCADQMLYENKRSMRR